MSSSNRSRCNTGSSTSSDSSSSRGSDSRKSNNGVGGLVVGTNPPTRRRSHRPRGCRGGRKNRKSQQAKAAALIPKEILDAPIPLSPRVGNVQQKKNGLQRKVARYRTPLVADPGASTTWKQQQQDTVEQQEQPRIWSRISADTTGGLPFTSNHSNASSSAFYSSKAVSNGTQHPLPAALYDNNGSQTNSKYRSNVPSESHPQFFRPLQPDRGSNNPSPVPIHPDYQSKMLHLSFMTSNRCLALDTHANNPSPPCDILPPLPLGATSLCESPPLPIMDGPNPYALSLSMSSNLNLARNSSNESMSGTESIRTQNVVLQNYTTSSGEAQPDDYRNQRIQKQRQMLANGGSLFVTSPRSFLLGGPKSFPHANNMAW